MVETILLVLLLLLMLYTALQFYRERAPHNGSAVEATKSADLPANVGGLQQSLRTLQLDIEPLVVVAGIILIALVVLLTLLDLFPDAVSLALVGSAGSLFLLFSLLTDIARWRTRIFEEGLVEALDLLEAALHSGFNPQDALRAAADSSKGSVKAEFEELSKRLAVGMPMDRAVARMTERYDSHGVRMVTQTLIANSQTGGNLLLLLRAVNVIFREQMKIRVKVRGQLAGARNALLFVAFVPYLIIPAFLWKAPSWLAALKDHPLGPSFLLAAILLQVLGFFWMRRILRTD